MTNQAYFVRQDRVLKRIDLTEIVILVASDNYVEFHAPRGYCLVRTSLEAALEVLSAEGFVRIHRSYAVKLDNIIEITKDTVQVKYQEIPAELPVARKFYPELMKQITVIGEGTGQKEGKLNMKREER